MNYPQIDPIIFQIGPLAVRWYGVMYLIGFVLAFVLLRARAKSRDDWQPAEVEDLIFYAALGVIIGGRIGYVLFYQFDSFLSNPLYLVEIHKGGMSFHGGLLGVMLGGAWFARKTRRSFFAVLDFMAPGGPLGLFFGRVGNFINGELWGKPTDVPWGFVVDGVRVHASQLYEAFSEGLLMFVIIWWFSAKPRPTMAVSGLFLLGYGVFRFAIEFVRVPDDHLKYLLFDWVTMGQLLSAPMIIVGAAMIFFAYRGEARATAASR